MVEKILLKLRNDLKMISQNDQQRFVNHLTWGLKRGLKKVNQN